MKITKARKCEVRVLYGTSLTFEYKGHRQAVTDIKTQKMLILRNAPEKKLQKIKTTRITLRK